MFARKPTRGSPKGVNITKKLVFSGDKEKEEEVVMVVIGAVVLFSLIR